MNFPDVSTTALAEILIGLVVLMAGRSLFWLFVGIVGFLAGWQFAGQVASVPPGPTLLLIAVGCGLVGAFLALLLQRLAVAVAGGLAGGLAAVNFVAAAGWTGTNVPLIAFVIGAILAALFISLLFDWALIVLSSLTGATMIIHQLTLDHAAASLAFVVLTAVGIVVQGGWRWRTTAAARTA